MHYLWGHFLPRGATKVSLQCPFVDPLRVSYYRDLFVDPFTVYYYSALFEEPISAPWSQKTVRGANLHYTVLKFRAMNEWN